MKIDIEAIAKEMVKRGHTKENIDADKLDGWSNDLLDILEEMHSLETAVCASIKGEPCEVSEK